VTRLRRLRTRSRFGGSAPAKTTPRLDDGLPHAGAPEIAELADGDEFKSPDRPVAKRLGKAIDWRFRVGDRVKIRLVNEMDSDHPMHHPFHIHGAGRFPHPVARRDRRAQFRLEGHSAGADRVDRRPVARRHESGRLAGSLPHRRGPRGACCSASPWSPDRAGLFLRGYDRGRFFDDGRDGPMTTASGIADSGDARRRDDLRLAGALLLVGFVVNGIQRMLLHPERGGRRSRGDLHRVRGE
jgi:hypothetical protein